jgi:hypothetical protein
MPRRQIRFADKNARIAWKIARKVSKIVGTISPEHPRMAAYQIRFSQKYRTPGTYAVLFSGTVVGTAQDGEFVVPERTLLILKKLHIPFIQGPSQ